VARFEGFSLSCGLVGFDTLLTETNSFHLTSRFGYNDVGFGWVSWGCFGLVEAGYASPCQSRVLFAGCHVLSLLELWR
jgi:hypothetical protein